MGIYNNIICAVDLSACSEATCKRAIELARCYEAKLTLLHVVEHFPQDRSNKEIAPEYTDPAKFREEHALSGMTGLTEQLGYKEAQHEVLFSTHTAWREIIRFVEARNADLLVLGSHGRHGISAVIGSTANSVVNHSPCDVLAVRCPA